MTNFFISQLKITGSEVRPATLEFKQGANIIYGNSDEGKSYIVECLDFMFGAKNMRLKASSGYSAIAMTIVTSEGSIDLVRRFDVSPKKSVSIFANDPRYKSLSCYEQSYEVLGDFLATFDGVLRKPGGYNEYLLQKRAFDYQKRYFALPF